MKRCKHITGWTDYPMVELGDIAGEKAPIRHIRVLSYDGNKLARVRCLETGCEIEIKAGYIYNKPEHHQLPWREGAVAYHIYPARFTNLGIRLRKLERMYPVKEST